VPSLMNLKPVAAQLPLSTRQPMHLTQRVGLYLRPTPSLFLRPVQLSSVRSILRSVAGAPAPSSRWGAVHYWLQAAQSVWRTFKTIP
jgi:hypothetical protein